MELSEFISILKEGETDKVEFKQSIPKELAKDVCGMLNTEGGLIILGVSDKGDIIGLEEEGKQKQKISDILNSIVPAIKFKLTAIDITPIVKGNKFVFLLDLDGNGKLYSYRNVVYVRVGRNNRPLSINELVERASESLMVFFDEQTMDVPLSKLSTDLIKLYLKEKEKRRGTVIKGNISDNIKKAKITISSKPTKAGIMVFCDHPQKYIPHSRIKLIWFEDERKMKFKDVQEFNGPLWKVIDFIQEYLTKNLKTIGGELEKFKRKQLFEYPLSAIREALINAIVHRNYFDVSETTIMIFPNKIMIRNPGSFPPGVTVEDPVHKCRNPLLAQFLYDLGYVEKYGSGIAKIKEACDEHPLVDVVFNIRPYITTVTFFKKTEKITERLDKLDKQILTILETSGYVTSSVLSKKLKRSVPTIVSRLNMLLFFDLIRKEGRGRSVKYRLIHK